MDIDVIFIEPNEYNIYENKVNDLTINLLREQIEDYIKFHKCFNNDINIIEMLCDKNIEYLSNNEKISLCTKIIYETKNSIYELIYIENCTNKNNFATTLIKSENNVNGCVLILKTLLNKKRTSCYIEEFYEIIFKNFIHTGVKINTDDTIDEFKFYYHPMDWMNLDDQKKMFTIEKKFANKILIFYLKENFEKKNNNNATILWKNNIIYDTCYLSLYEIENNELIYKNIDNELYKKILEISKKTNDDYSCNSIGIYDNIITFDLYIDAIIDNLKNNSYIEISPISSINELYIDKKNMI